MDAEQRRTLNELIIQQTTKNKSNSIDSNAIKHLKDICRQSDDYVRVAFRQLFHQLEANNSHKRYLALLLCGELMARSKVFRQQMADEMQGFIMLTIVGGELKKGQKLYMAPSQKVPLVNRRRSHLQTTHSAALLPPPLESANMLRAMSLQCIEEWDAKYGETYRKIHLGYKYIKEVLEFTFPNLRQREARATRERQERQHVAQDILRSKFNTISAEFDDTVLKVLVVLKQMGVLFLQIIPNVDDVLHTGGYDSENEHEVDHGEARSSAAAAAAVPHTEDNGEDDEWESVLENNDDLDDTDDDQYGLDEIIQAAGLGSSDFELPVEINTQFGNLRTKDNKILFECLRDGLNQLVRTYEPTVLEWVNVLTNVDLASSQDKSRRQTMIAKAIHLKQRIVDAKGKCAELEIESSVEQPSVIRSVFDEEMDSIVKRVMERKRRVSLASSSSSPSSISSRSRNAVRKRPLPSVLSGSLSRRKQRLGN